MAPRPTWTLTGPVNRPDGSPHVGLRVTVALIPGVVNDPAGDDLRVGTVTAVVQDGGVLRLEDGGKDSGAPVTLLASTDPDHPIRYRISFSPALLPTRLIEAPLAGEVRALDDLIESVTLPIPTEDAVALRASLTGARVAAEQAALDATTQAATATTQAASAAASAAAADAAKTSAAGSASTATTAQAAAGASATAAAGSATAAQSSATGAQTSETAAAALAASAGSAAAAAVGKVRGATAIVKADGSGDYATPEAALAAIGAAGGGTVLLRAGTYQTQGMTVPSNTILRGEGASTIIRSNNSAPWNTISTANNGSNILIADLAVDGNRAGQALAAFSTVVVNSSRTIVRGCWITGSPGYALVSYGQPGMSGNDLVFSGNVIYDNAKEGIETQGSSRVAITGNVVRNCGYNGILVWANTAQGGTSSDVTITGNTVSGYGLLTTSSGIRIDDGATDVTITGNTISGAGRANCFGILVQSATAAPVKRVTVMGNAVSESSAFGPTGIAFFGALVASINVFGNTVTGCSTGINIAASATDIAVTGNAVSACTGNGVNISGSGITLASNTVTGCGGTASSGINIGGSDATVTGNRVSGSGNAGIAFVAGGSGTCSGNAVTASRGCGIGVFNTSNVAISGNISTNNGAATQQHGIFVTQWSTGVVAGVIVTGNRCYDTRAAGSKTQQYGIRVSGVVTDTHIGPNLHTGNSVAGQLIDGTATVTTVAP